MAASLVMHVPDFHIGFLDADGCLAFMDKLPDVEAMIERLMAARRAPTLDLDPVCMDVLLALFMPASAEKPIEVIQRYELSGHFDLMEQALLEGAIWPDAGGVFRCTRQFISLLTQTTH